MKTSIGHNQKPGNTREYISNIQMLLPEDEFKPFIEALALAGTEYSHILIVQLAKLIKKIQDDRERISTSDIEI